MGFDGLNTGAIAISLTAGKLLRKEEEDVKTHLDELENGAASEEEEGEVINFLGRKDPSEPPGPGDRR